MGRRGLRLSSQIFAFQVLILGGVIAVGVTLVLMAVRSELDREYQLRALGVARTVAATPEIARAVAAADRSWTVQRRAEAVRRATRVAFVVVADRRGIRYSHPRPENVGRRVSTDPAEALAGRTVLAVEKGTLGRSARARVPLRRDDGRIVGVVNVGVLTSTIGHDLAATVPVVLLYAVIALILGLVASLLLARRLKRQTFGLELREIASLLREREATLNGIREGVISIDPHGRIQVVNGEAVRLLSLPPDAVGRLAADVAPEGSRLDNLLEGRLAGDDRVLMHGDRILVANRMPVRRDGRDLGWVITFRDRTEFDSLTRELDSVRGLTDALRAQAHEFSNRLHTVSGLLQLGHHEEAESFIKEIAESDARLRHTLADRVADSRLAALLLAKSTVAAERGVEVQLAPDLEFGGELIDAPAVLSVVGNLLDNAVDAARSRQAARPWVELGVAVERDGSLRLRVGDSGPGVPRSLREKIFEPGYTTKPPALVGERGVGLALVRRTLERRGGTLEVREASGGGALFVAFMPEAVRLVPLPTPLDPKVLAS